MSDATSLHGVLSRTESPAAASSHSWRKKRCCWPLEALFKLLLSKEKEKVTQHLCVCVYSNYYTKKKKMMKRASFGGDSLMELYR